MKDKRKMERDRTAEAAMGSLFGDEPKETPPAAESRAEPQSTLPPAAESRTEAPPPPVEARAAADVDDVPPGLQPPDRLARARKLFAEGRLDQAVTLYRQILWDEPNNLKAYNNLGLLYEGMGQFENALDQYASARAIDPDNAAVLSNVGGALIGLGRLGDAERELRRALKLQTDSVDAHANLGILYFRRGQYLQAESELRWVCERDAAHASAHYYRGEALNRLNQVDKAIEVLEHAARLQPHSAKIYHSLGVLFDKKNMPAEATRMYRKVRELSR